MSDQKQDETKDRILIQDGHRIGQGPYTEAEATTAKKKLQPIQEGKGKKAPIEIKRQLNG